MINTIIFDLAEVLLTGFLGVDKKISTVLDVDKSKVVAVLYNDDFNELMEGKITEIDFWNRVIKMGGWDIPVNMLSTLIRDNFREIDGVRKLIGVLKANYRLSLLSNHAREWIEYCENKFNYNHLFDVRMYSYNVGLRKPQAKIFEAMLDKMSTKPENCLFIDDSKENVISACKLGIQSVQFNSPEKLIEDLKSLGII